MGDALGARNIGVSDPVTSTRKMEDFGSDRSVSSLEVLRCGLAPLTSGLLDEGQSVRLLYAPRGGGTCSTRVLLPLCSLDR